MQEIEQVCLKPTMHEQGRSADTERTQKVTVECANQAEMLLKMQGWITEIKLKLVRDIGKEWKGFFKYKINIRKVEKDVGPQMRGYRRFSDKEAVKVLSVFHSVCTWKVWTQVSTSLEHMGKFH